MAVLWGVPPGRRRLPGGQSIVEFALILPLLALLVLGAVDLTRSFYYYIILQNATREAARVLIDFPEEYSDTNACAAAVREAQNYLTLTCSGGSPSITVSPAANSAGNPPIRQPGRHPVTVTATASFQPMTLLIQNFVPGGVITLKAQTTMLTWY
jgi:Flp pilus assembly protein TadG